MDLLLPMMIAVPGLGSLGGMLISRRRYRTARWGAFGLAVAEVVGAGWLLATTLPPGRGQAFSRLWIPGLQIRLALEVDLLSAAFMAAAAVGTALALIPWLHGSDGWRRRVVCMLALCAAAMGVFAAADFIVFVAFFEVAALPLYGLVRGRGSAAREHAARRLFMLAIVGGGALLSSAMLLAETHRGMTGTLCFSLPRLLSMEVPLGVQWWVLVAAGGAFLLRMGVVPGHAALIAASRRLAAAEAILVLAVWVPTGSYGLLRLWTPLTAGAGGQVQWLLLAWGWMGLLYSGLLATVQPTCGGSLVRICGGLGSLVLLGLATSHEAGWLGAVLLALTMGPGMMALVLLAWPVTHALVGDGRVVPGAAASASGSSPGARSASPGQGREAARTCSPEPADATWDNATRGAWGGIRWVGLLVIGLPGGGAFVALLLVWTAVAGLAPGLAWTGALGTGLLGLALLRACASAAAPGERPRVRGWRLALATPLLLGLLWVGLRPTPVLVALTASGQRLLRSAEIQRQVVQRLQGAPLLGATVRGDARSESP